MPDPEIVPFRWDLRRREQLGGLIEGEEDFDYPGFLDHLRDCTARVVATAGDSDLVFVGRSPESLFDYLSGLALQTSWFERLTLLQLSMRGWIGRTGKLLAQYPGAAMGLSAYLGELGLDPATLKARPRPVALIDMVSTGATFGAFTAFLQTWCGEVREDWGAVHRKLRYVGITEREKTRPKTWRWQQNNDWVASVPEAVIKNVSAPTEFWSHLANFAAKTTHSYGSRRWDMSEPAAPPRNPDQLRALRLAVRLFDAGCARDERRRFAGLLARQREMREPWLRALALELKGRGG